MNLAQLHMMKSDAHSKIAAVNDPAVRAALEAILKVALLYPDSASGAQRGAY